MTEKLAGLRRDMSLLVAMTAVALVLEVANLWLKFVILSRLP